MDIDNLIDWVAFYTDQLHAKPQPAGTNKYNACCPFHHEDNPSFWFNTENGLWKCEAGCGSGNATSFLARLHGISTGEAWAKLCAIAGVKPEEKAPKKQKPRLPLTLAEYADSKQLSMETLGSLGVRDHTDKAGVACVAIPYYDANGQQTATKLRYHPDGQRFGYLPGGKTTLYGLWLPLNRDARAVVLVEGESDAQSLWSHGIPCYGVPGAGNFQRQWTSVLQDRDVYLHLEPGNSGDVFLRNTCKALKDGGYQGKLRCFRCAEIREDAKDPSDLHILVPDKDECTRLLRTALKNAAPVDMAAQAPVRQAVPTQPRAKTIKPLEVYRASELYGKKLERPPVIVSNMIPAGLTVLAGAPKRGKSWLALQMALSVAGGEPFLGMPTEQGDVLYLDLESRQYRVQKRLSMLIPGRAPDKLQIAHEAAMLDGGLIEQLGLWCDSVPKPSLIIIDTLGRIKGRARMGENAYDGDTRLLGSLQSFALGRKTAIVCVHHMRKSMPDGDDFFERISGSMGITGACDQVIALGGKRDEPDNASLKTGGRDFEALDLVVGFRDGVWSLKSANSEEYRAEREYMQSPVIRGVIGIAEKLQRWEGTPSQLIEMLCNMVSVPIDATPSVLFRDHISPYIRMLHDRDGVMVSAKRTGKRGRVVTIRKADSNGF